MDVAEKRGAVVVLMRAVHVGKDDGATLRIMDGHKLGSVGVGALEAANPMDGPSGDNDIGAVRPTVPPSLALPDTAIKLPLLARGPETGHHTCGNASLLETKDVDVLVGNHI